MEYCISCFRQNTIQKMKNIHSAFSRCLRACPACAHSSLQARREFVMSRCHTRGSIVGARKRPYFFNFFIYFSLVSVVSFRSFPSFRWFRFGRFVSLFRVLVHPILVCLVTFKLSRQQAAIHRMRRSHSDIPAA